MKRVIRKIAVIGAGVMGQGIAAHFANAGIRCLLLDRTPAELTDQERKLGLSLASLQVRNRYCAAGKANLLKAKPALLYHPDYADRISVGNMEDDAHLLKEADWIIEAIVENMEEKQTLFAKVDQVRRAGTLISSNTSGLSINRMAENRSADFKKCFLGTHFFNPVRYMKLVEVIPGQETDPELVEFVGRFGTQVLGKGVVICKDTVNFIANRIGTYGLMAALEQMKQFGLGFDEVDAVTGPVLGRPKSATFRTLDLVGLDTFVHVAGNVYENTDDPAEKRVFQVPGFILELVKRGWNGQKAGRGFYQKTGSDIAVLDPDTFEYRPQSKRKFASLEAANLQKGTAGKIKTLLAGDDEAARFAWSLTKQVLLYSATHAFEIADDIVQIDQAMKWGFNWEYGPFELWDHLGVPETVQRMRAEGESVPEWVQRLLTSGSVCFYKRDGDSTAFATQSGQYERSNLNLNLLVLSRIKEQGKTILKNSGASLLDIGDDVALLEFHSPKQAIGSDITQMIRKAAGEVSANWRGLVIGNQGKHFCVGANLMLMLMEAQDENWEEIDSIVQEFQQVLLELKYMSRPVVAAPFSMTLGGGAEIAFAASQIQAAAETYMGLVEAGVGLLPAGGGNKELLLRHIEQVQDKTQLDLQPYVNQVFETIAMAKVSSSAADAKALGFLRSTDGISMQADHLLADAKQAVLRLDEQGYVPPAKKPVRVVGEGGYAMMLAAAYSMLQGGYISKHDYKIAGKIAFVLAGGRVPAGSLVSEDYLLELEREAFLSLVAEPKTQERMQYMLTKGKPLRN